MNATNAVNATNLARPESVHLVGAPGQPAFEGGFVNFLGGQYEPAGFYLDRQCTVHLSGTITGSPGTAFTLPAGFRPAKETFTVVPATAEFANLQIPPDGSINLSGVTGSHNFGLDGQTFRVAGC